MVLRDNVGFESIGHCFFLEDASEELNVIDRNLAINARSVSYGVIPSDSTAAGFWITNANNTVGLQRPALPCTGMPMVTLERQNGMA